MGITKNHIHTQDQIDIAQLFKALGHPARIAIVENLMIHDNLKCGDLKLHINLAQSTISAHLKELHDVGILSVCVVGSTAYYQLNKSAIEQMANYLEQLEDRIENKKRLQLMAFLKPMRHLRSVNFKNYS